MSDIVPETLYLLYESSHKLVSKCFYAKKVSSTPKLKPAFLSRKAYDSLFKVIAKKFPNYESYNSPSLTGELTRISTEVKESCEVIYSSFVDVLTFKDSFSVLLNQYTTLHPRVDLISHSQLCIYFLEIVSSLAICLYLISSIEDRKLIAVSYGLAYESIHRAQDSSFMKVCNMINEYEQPFKQLSEDLVSCSKIIEDSLTLLVDDFRTSSIEGKQMQNTFFFNLSGLPQMIAVPLNSHIPELQYCGNSSFFKWIYYCTLVFPNVINNPPIYSMLSQILSLNLVIPLCKDEVLLLHKEITSVIENNKNLSKKSKDISEFYHAAYANFIQYHKDRRDYFLSAIHEVNLLVQDQPGILGPKLLHILQILALTSDEIKCWFTHYQSSELIKLKKGTQELFDLNILQLLFEVYVLKNNMLRYIQVIQQYYVNFLMDHDAHAVFEMIKMEDKFEENDAETLRNLHKTISNLEVARAVEISGSVIPLSIRLDWLRLQYKNTLGSSNPCMFRTQSSYLNNIHYHSLALDSLPKMLQAICSTYDACFFPTTIDQLLKEAIDQSKLSRYVSITCLIYGETNAEVNNLCPDEIMTVCDQAITCIDSNLDQIAKACISTFADFWKAFQESLKNASVSSAAISWLYKYVETRKELSKKLQLPLLGPAGMETKLTLKEEISALTTTFMNLQEICLSLSTYRSIKVSERSFYLRQSTLPYLESFIKSEILTFLKKTESTDKSTLGDIQRPSIVLLNVKNLLSAITILGSLLDMNLNNIFFSSMIALSMPTDLANTNTLTSSYSSWFTNVFLTKDFTIGNILFCNTRHSFIVKSFSPFRADEYTDINEMRALAELIGPYGIRHMCLNIDHMIANELDNIKKFITPIQTILGNFDKLIQSSTSIEDSFKKIKGIDEVITSLTVIGAMFSLKTLLREGLKYNIDKKSPLMAHAVRWWQGKIETNEIVSKVSTSLGYEQATIDYELVEKLYIHQASREVDKPIWTKYFALLLPFIVSYLAIKGNADYLLPIEAFPNNLHLIILSFNKLMPILFVRFRIEDYLDYFSKMEELIKYLAMVVIKLYQGTLSASPIKNKEMFFVLFELLAKNNQFINNGMIEKYVPVCLITSVINRLQKNKSMMTKKVKGKG